MRTFSCSLLALIPLVCAIPLEPVQQEQAVSMISYQQGSDYIYQYVPTSSLYEYRMNKVYQYNQEPHEEYSIVQVEEGHQVSNLIVYDKSVIYTDIQSFTVPSIPAMPSQNPYVLDFSETSTTSSSSSLDK